ncbi:MAG: DUF1015 domain-containing protein [Elusimicrobiota bacterium]
MTDIIPFRAIRYNKKNISGLICPPYDIISPSEKKLYLKKNPYNAVRIELPEDYQSAKKNFDLWLSKKVLIRDTHPSFYIYEQNFKFEGKKYVRSGFLALLKTEQFGKNIFPHEKTLSKPKQDRLNLLKRTRINTSPIFCLFSDRKKMFSKITEKIKRQSPTEFARFSDISEKMWAVSDEKTINFLKIILINNKILIADGHHRYETFFEFTKPLLKNPLGGAGLTSGGYILTFLCPFESKGLLVLPTHRLVKNWTEKDTQKLKGFFCSPGTDKKWDFKFYINGRFYYLKVPKKYKGLSIEFLHSVILENKKVEYTKNENCALRSVDKGDFSACVILKSLSVDTLKSVIKKRKLLPPKSTYFYPKVSTGFVFNEIVACK